jgi:Holliday junction resolvase RusA-like endonuclease
MSVRKKKWTAATKGDREAWIVDYQDVHGVRRQKAFDRKKDADAYHACAKAGIVPPRPLRPTHADALAFTVPLSLVRLRAYKDGAAGRLRVEKRRAAIREALTSTHPNIRPVMGDVIVHVTAEVPRAAAVPDVDNLLKPVMDAMVGIVYLDDTQVVECLVRKIPSHESRMKIEVWGSCLTQ